MLLFVVVQDASFVLIVMSNFGLMWYFGNSSFLGCSDGIQIAPPKYLKRSEEKLAKTQRQFSHKKKGSNRRKKSRLLFAREHEKVANQRLDFCHKTAHSI